MYGSEIDKLLDCEQQERRAASEAADPDSRDTHIIQAERFADLAWRLNEAEGDMPHSPSGLWD